MKHFTKSTILGLTLGVFLVAYAVFAFTPPSSAPPGGNVSMPLNVGPDLQEKTGNLLINSLGVLGNLAAGGIIESTVGGFKFPDGSVQSVAAEVPSGAVMFFNLASCPSGWSELAGAQGRYIVGLPSGGTLGGTVGTALSNQENRAVGQHGHTINDPGHTHSEGQRSTNISVTDDGKSQRTVSRGRKIVATGSSVTGITINDAGSVVGTNAPYIQLLTCQKD